MISYSDLFFVILVTFNKRSKLNLFLCFVVNSRSFIKSVSFMVFGCKQKPHSPSFSFWTNEFDWTGIHKIPCLKYGHLEIPSTKNLKLNLFKHFSVLRSKVPEGETQIVDFIFNEFNASIPFSILLNCVSYSCPANSLFFSLYLNYPDLFFEYTWL